MNNIKTRPREISALQVYIDHAGCQGEKIIKWAELEVPAYDDPGKGW